MAEYEFLTVWRLAAPIDRVWEAIYDLEAWPEWWKGVESVERLEQGDERGIGSLWRYVWRSKLPYNLVFQTRTTRIERPHVLAGEAEGELEGSGRWVLAEVEEGTLVRYTWRVRTTKTWMNLLAPIMRPVFAWNHDVVMRQGGEGLARLLGVQLL